MPYSDKFYFIRKGESDSKQETLNETKNILLLISEF